ncbi:MAG: acyltransferase [Bacteroidales bacterium]
MRKLVYKLIYSSLKLFAGKTFANKAYNPFTLLHYFFYQKLLRINGRVKWPVHRSSKVVCPQNIIRGTRSPGMNRNCYLDARNGIHFGKNVWMGPGVNIISMNHSLTDYTSYIKAPPIKIGDNCWLATNVTITAGVTLGNHVVIAAGAVVTKSFEQDNLLIGGVPAKIIKELPPYKEKKTNEEN